MNLGRLWTALRRRYRNWVLTRALVGRRRRNWVLSRDFRREFRDFERLARAAGSRLPVRWGDRFPCLNEKAPSTGFDAHYVYHCAWATRNVARIQPRVHVDISSYLLFCAQLSAFLPVQFYDYRPADLHLSNLTCGREDLTRLSFADGSIKSLSCMHVVEHIGLGRYGDSLGPDDDLRAMGELKRVLAPGGNLLFVVPVGRPRVCFNAHRIYSYSQIRDAFGKLELMNFALVPDDPSGIGLIENADPALADAQSYGCGCFLFRRPA